MLRESQASGGPGDPQAALATYAVLTGLTPLIPIPFVDDLARDYSRRRLVHALAAHRGIPLPAGAVEALTTERGGCLVGGCLTQALIYPLRKIFAKVFIFLEWKRALDLTSQTYHFGYLVDCALQDGYLGGSSRRSVDEVRQAIEAVCRAAPVRPVESAVAATFRQSKSALTGAVGELSRRFKGLTGRAERARVEATLASAEEQERKQVAGVAAALQERLRAVPDAHFQRLREQLRNRLG